MKKLILLVLACCACAWLPPAQGQVRILPMGDSVTSSFSPNYSYRFFLWRILNRNGYNVDFVGTQWGVAGGAPGRSDFDQNHEGYPGWTTADAVFAADSIAAATVPHIVLLDIGANDIMDGIPWKETRDNLISIIESFRAVNPRVLVVLTQTTPYAGQSKRGMSLLKQAVKQAAKIERRRGARVAIVNLAASFNVRRDTVDGVHPNEKGERKIASRYYNYLRKVLRRSRQAR